MWEVEAVDQLVVGVLEVAKFGFGAGFTALVEITKDEAVDETDQAGERANDEHPIVVEAKHRTNRDPDNGSDE